MKLAARLRQALDAPPPDRIQPGDIPDLAPSRPVSAAVLVAITDRDNPGILLTVRRENLRTHAGQISFPGGRLDTGESAVEAALREAFEELDLPPDRVEVAGLADPYHTVTNYLVTPVVGVIAPDLPLSPHDAEVSDWFEAPLDHLLDAANHARQSAVFAGRERHYYEIMWEGRRIWGATAAMLVNLSKRLPWP